MVKISKKKAAIFFTHGMGVSFFFLFLGYASITDYFWILNLNFFYYMWLISFYVACLNLLACPITLCFKKFRNITFPILVFCLGYFSFLFSGYIAGYYHGESGLIKVPENSQLLIKAIKNFENENGRPPEELRELIPNFIDSIPSSGMIYNSKFKLILDKNLNVRPIGREGWSLSTDVMINLQNYYYLSYYSNSEYPDYSFKPKNPLNYNWSYHKYKYNY